MPQTLAIELPTSNELKKTSLGTRRPAWAKLLLLMFGLGAGILLSELVVRAFHLGHTNTVQRYNNKILKLRPNVGFMNYEENTNWLETNNLGFHDHERQAANDNYRILFIGDSFVEGRQVNTDSLFTIRLEKKFAETGQKIETINGGVLGTGTAYQYVLWKDFFEPNVKIDHLVLCFYMGNDLVDNNAELMTAAFPGTDHAFFVDAQGQIQDRGKRPGLFKEMVTHVRDYSVLFNTLYEGAYQLKKGRENRAGSPAENKAGRAVLNPQVTGINNRAWEVSESGTIALIERWQSELAQRKLPFDIVIIDKPGGGYSPSELEFLARLQAICARDQIGCLRLKLTANPFETYSFDGKKLGHFNQRGHELAAGEIFDYFKSRHPEIFR